MSQENIRLHVGDTRTLLSFILKQPDASGDLQVVDIASLAPQFKMINMGDGSTEVALTTTGVAIVSGPAGTCTYDFSSAGIDTPGKYRCFMVATDTGETDHFPVRANDMILLIDSDTQTAEEAYDALVNA